MRKLYAKSLYWYAVRIEYARPAFLDWQLGIMIRILKVRNWILGATPDQSRDSEVDAAYQHRFSNWNKLVFIKNPHSDWIANWGEFFRMAF